MSKQKTCPECNQPMLADGQQRQHEDDYRHASGCPNDDTICTNCDGSADYRNDNSSGGKMNDNKTWTVYCCRCGDLHKIGHSARPDARIRSLHGREIFRVDCPNKAVACVIEDGLHAKFAKWRIAGREWFRLPDLAERKLMGVEGGTLGQVSWWGSSKQTVVEAQ